MMLETSRLIVRDFREADAEVLYAIKTDQQVQYFCPDFLDVEVAAEDVVRYIRDFNRAEAEHDPDPWRCYAIEVKETHAIVGCLCFGRQNMLHEYELGWMMIGKYAGHGYAS
ncbi:MAG: GNAT family N-acetyltransferase, partial [Clostridia bacterium]|nr:GNAT family N-acetyltransferase [Clostridia bacterium]